MLAGYALGVALALPIGARVGLNRRTESILAPTFQALRAIPGLAWVPLRIIARLDRDYEGEVVFAGTRQSGLNREIGFVCPEPRLFPWLNVAPMSPSASARGTRRACRRCWSRSGLGRATGATRNSPG
ncbi:hypothetical protein [Ancylobacter vacuolatus]|uniref:Uncharacterized protein n=1 Tax=Ancylobacter vacuolatus TaxID=223389 RepID=A0ABU0DJN3_9HYPH|nr:hypothetical protein [Ancylobacter vacuolatus]MDQ0348629.1 hypothetical protein [Ancylobacter vacuolatus]